MTSTKQFVQKAFLFVLPFALVAGMVAMIDPYQYFTADGCIGVDVKRPIAYPLNYALWKLIAYNRDPCPNILLGDSRMNLLRPNVVRKRTGERYTNLSYGSGTLAEVCATFWYAAERVQLQNVYIGINLNHFALSNAGNRVSPARAVMKNPFLYLSNRNVLKATWLILKAEIKRQLFGATRTINLETPGMTSEAFWKYQLDVTAKRYYGNFVYAVNAVDKLADIAAYCDRKGVHLVFVILPTHADLHSRIVGFGLASEQTRMVADLERVGDLIDLNCLDGITKDRSCFMDPFHFNEATASQVVDRVWSPPLNVPEAPLLP